MLRKMFGPKMDQVTGEWRRVHSKDITEPLKSRRMRWLGHVACMGERRGAYRVMVGKAEGEGPLGRPRRRWDDIKMDL
jgi:hypothetical protein